MSDCLTCLESLLQRERETLNIIEKMIAAELEKEE